MLSQMNMFHKMKIICICSKLFSDMEKQFINVLQKSKQSIAWLNNYLTNNCCTHRDNILQNIRAYIVGNLNPYKAIWY